MDKAIDAKAKNIKEFPIQSNASIKVCRIVYSCLYLTKILKLVKQNLIATLRFLTYANSEICGKREPRIQGRALYFQKIDEPGIKVDLAENSFYNKTMNWNKKNEALDLSNIGLIYHIKGNKDKALDYLNQALAIFKQIGAPREIEQTKKDIQLLKRK